jgi:hypothetical protein
MRRTTTTARGRRTMNRCKLLLATLGAAALICALVGAASARTLSSSSQTFTVVFHLFRPQEIRREPEQNERLEITGAFGSYRCSLTLEGSFHTRTIAKTVGALIGYVTRASLNPICSTSLFETRVLTETLPWHLRYRSFSGLLPNITTVSTAIVGFAFQIRENAFAIRCLGTSTAESPFVLDFTRETATGALRQASASGTITTNCPGGPAPRLTFGGTTRVAEAISPMTVTLI